MSDSSRIAVRNEQGRIVYIDKADSEDLIKRGFYTPVSDKELAAHKEKVEENRRYEGIAQGGLAGLEALGRGATLGGTDFLASQIASEDYLKAIEARKRHHPWIAGGGELLGFGLPLLATGGAAEAGELGLAGALKAATSAPRLVGEAGELTGAAVKSLVGEGLAGKVATAAARGAAENALLSAGDAVSEDSLSGHPELIAEHLMPHMAKGALLGAGLGAGLSGVLGAYGHVRGAKKLVAPLTEAAQKATQEVEAMRAAAPEAVAPEGVAGEAVPVEAVTPEAQVPVASEVSSKPTIEDVLGEKTPRKLVPNRFSRRQSLEAAMGEGPVTVTPPSAEELASRDAIEKLNQTAGAGFEPPKTFGLGGPNIPLAGAASAEESELAKAMREAEEARRASAKAQGPKTQAPEAPSPLLSEEQPSFREKVSSKLQEKANEALVGSLDPSLQHYRQIKKFAGGVQELAPNIREAVQRVYGHSEGQMTEKKWLHLAEVEKESAAKLQENVAAKLDQAPTQIQAPDLIAQVQDYANSLVGGENKAKAAAARHLVDDLREDIGRVVQKGPSRMYGPTHHGAFEAGDTILHSDLWKLRQGFDERLERFYKSAAAIPQDTQEAAHDIRHILEDAYITSADRASQELGVASISDEWKKAKKMYQTSRYIDDVVNAAENRRLKNSGVGLINTLVGVGAAAHYGLLPGLAAAAGAKVLREFGPQLESAALTKTAKLLAVDKAAQTSRKELAEGVNAFFSEKAPRAVKNLELPFLFAGHTQKERLESFEKYVAGIKERVGDPDAHLEHVASKLGSLPQDAPKVAQALIQKDMAKDQYLLSKLPNSHTDPNNAFPDKKPLPVSDTEIARFSRYAAVAEKGPKVLVDELKSGSVNPETLDATKHIFPETWDELKKDILDRAAKREKDFTFPQKQQLHNLLGVQTDRLYNPASVQFLQANYANVQKAQAKGKMPSMHGASPRAGQGSGMSTRHPRLNFARFYAMPLGALEGVE